VADFRGFLAPKFTPVTRLMPVSSQFGWQFRWQNWLVLLAGAVLVALALVIFLASWP
jgi:hypothetical protein